MRRMSSQTPTAPPAAAPSAEEESRTTSSEIPVRPFYRPEDAAAIP